MVLAHDLDFVCGAWQESDPRQPETSRHSAISGVGQGRCTAPFGLSFGGTSGGSLGDLWGDLRSGYLEGPLETKSHLLWRW